jgi:hypothetical protein
MLQRKPRIGDRLSLGKSGFGTVTEVKDNGICWYLPDGATDSPRYWSCFIWQFTEGLNRLVSIVDDDETTLIKGA